MIRLNVATTPELADISLDKINLRWSKHAKQRAEQKQVLKADNLFITAGSVVEAELAGKQLTKLVVRLPSCEEYDAVYVIKPDQYGCWFVITCWINSVNDQHSTLDKSRLGKVA